MVIDLSSLETVWVVIANDGIDEEERLIAFTTNQDDAQRALDALRNGTLVDPGRGGRFGPNRPGPGPTYHVQTVTRWPGYGQRTDEATARYLGRS